MRHLWNRSARHSRWIGAFLANVLVLGAAAAALSACGWVADLGQFDTATAGGSEGDDGAIVADSEADDAAISAEGAVSTGPNPVGGPPDATSMPTDAVAVAYEDDAEAKAPSGPTTMPDGMSDAAGTGTAPDPADAPDAPVATTPNGPDASEESDAPVASTPDAGDAAAPSWCSGHAASTRFDCHDFDEGNPPPFGFSSTFEPEVFSQVSTQDHALGSSPSSLLIATPALAAGASSVSQQFADVLPYHGKVELNFELKIVNFDTGAGVVSLARVGYQDAAWGVTLDYTGTSASLNEAAPLPDGGTYRQAHNTSQPSTFAAWNDIDLLLDFGAHTMSLAYNGVAVVSNQPIANPTQTNPNISIIMGLNYLGPPAKPMSIFLDDIVISTPP
jgi:hypothetical protein